MPSTRTSIELDYNPAGFDLSNQNVGVDSKGPNGRLGVLWRFVRIAQFQTRQPGLRPAPFGRAALPAKLRSSTLGAFGSGFETGPPRLKLRCGYAACRCALGYQVFRVPLVLYFPGSTHLDP